MESQTPTKNSSSYIKVWCSNDADPKLNRLQLNTNPPTYIELQPGLNELTVEQYPALKYGFRPVWVEHRAWCEPNPNCQSVIEIDMSHFDASYVKSTEYMFECMCNLEIINLSNVKFSNVEKMGHMFSRCIKLKEIIKNSNDTFRSNHLVSAPYMFGQVASLKKLSLPYFVHSRVEDISDMFDSMLQIEILDLSGWNLRGTKVTTPGMSDSMFEGCNNLSKVYAIGCNEFTLKKIRKQLNDSEAFKAKIISSISI